MPLRSARRYQPVFKNNTSTWQLWAFLASAFAALTALLAKVRVTGIDSNLTTFMRTLVVAACLKP
jgi:uncharacterized membrane protein